ncbi:EGF-like domain protein [Teladorsagia circumcincta]|uniref:EGF-like domain protein n=1 Tax=Teladorsagia circumcincta TaxID=45464 RepID=A0A2G9UPE4_TELCI|nr:EGF-like domain protein [Teladorsagia circumcincta]
MLPNTTSFQMMSGIRCDGFGHLMIADAKARTLKSCDDESSEMCSRRQDEMVWLAALSRTLTYDRSTSFLRRTILLFTNVNMRELLAIVLLKFILASDIGLNLPCNRELDGLLAVDPDGDPSAFLSCQSPGEGSMGYWERKVCPGAMVFDFINQQCRERKHKHRKQPILNIAGPGQSCRENEICAGGSICTFPIALCLCPGELEEQDGECVLPPTAAILIAKALTYLPRTLAKPSQPPTMPATYPPSRPQPVFVPSTTPVPIYTPHPTQPHPQPAQPMQPVHSYSQSPFGGHYVQSPNINQEKPQTSHTMQPSQPSYFNYQSSMSPAPVRPSGKSNQMKISLGGSKQSGVGVQCSLNTDCMIGAYCNGNTQPPTCQCLSTHVNIEGRCEKEEVLANEKCGDIHGVHQTCSKGFICTNHSGVCVSVIGAFKNINGQCTVGDRCSGGSTCRANVCQCIDGSSEHHGRCRQSPGGRCTYGETCDGGSSCEFGLCRCPDGHIISSGKCVMGSAEPGKSCQNGQKCVHGSVCRFGMCMCVAKYVTSKGRCVRRENVLTSISSTTAVTTPIKVGSLKGPGFECHEKDICNGGSTCREGFCVCSDLEVIINGQCVGSHEKANEVVDNLLVAAPGQPCDARTNCTGGSTCINRACTCEHGAIDESGRCSEVKKEYGANAAPAKKSPDQFQPGSACALTIECPYRTQCVRGVCRCKKGETIVDNTCRKAIHQVLPGGKCDPRKGYDCIGEAHCFYGVCTCTRHLINNGKECVTVSEMEMVTPGKRCGPGQSCNGGSRCIDGICRCPEDEVPDVNKKCVKKSQVYPVFDKFSVPSTTLVYRPEPVLPTTTPVPNITPALDMMGELEAFEAMLKANPSFSQTEAPVPQTIFGHTCQTKDDCPANAFCFQQLCRCMIGFRASAGYCQPISASCVTPSADQGKPCAQLAHPGEDCTHGQVCSFNSYCGLFSGVCECPSGMATTNERCERTMAAPGLGCVTSRNCYGPSYCDNGLCLCKTGYELVNDFCVLVGQTPQGSMKDLSIQPIEPYVTSTDECVDVPRNANLAGIGESCRNGEICLGGSRCLQNICMCDENRHDILGICVTTARPGDDCSNGQICVDGAVCAASVKACVCPPGRISKLGRCVEKEHALGEPKMVGPGSECGSQAICDDNSFCSGEGVCVCLPRFELYGEKCVPNVMIKHPGDGCSSGNICSAGSECKDNVCTCPSGQLIIEGKCVRVTNDIRKRPVRPDCTSDADCSDHYHCVDQKCVCHGNFSHCLRLVLKRAEASCIEDAHCPQNAVCTGNICTCKDEYKMISNFCVPSDMNKWRIVKGTKTVKDIALDKGSEPGASCSDANFCTVGSVCINGQCVCDFESVPKDGSCVSRSGNLGVGEHCSDAYKCRDGLVCVLERCMCPDDDLTCDGVFP